MKRPMKRAVLLPLVGMLLGASAAPKADIPQELSGRWSYVGGETEREGIEQAIERSIDGMSFLARPFARRRLEASNKVPARVEIAIGGERVLVRMDARNYDARLGAPPVGGFGSTGDPVRYAHRAEDGHLQQVFIAPRGRRYNTFELLSPDRLVMHVAIISRHLGAPVRYRLSYARR